MPLRPGARAWAVWAVALAAYVVAVLHRTSLGVAGLDAQQRFGIGAGALGLFAVLQLLVYAGLQVPVGMLLDRFGSLRLVVAGALVMAAGQAMMAFTDDITGAVLARILVGAGDAMTFISVLRLVPQWFPARRVPLVTQLTGIFGQLGQVLSAVPLAILLAGPGWTPAFVSAAAAGVFVGIVALVALRDTPQRRISSGPALTLERLGDDVSGAWRHPGTRLGLWSHFTTQFTGTVFALMWGVPFLVAGFVASLVSILLVGLILDARTGGTASYGIDDFKLAMSVQFMVGAIGLVGILRTRRLARKRLFAEEGIVVRPLREALVERTRGGR
jgi:MFS family permease